MNKSDFKLDGLKLFFYKTNLWYINKGIMKPCGLKALLK